MPAKEKRVRYRVGRAPQWALEELRSYLAGIGVDPTQFVGGGPLGLTCFGDLCLIHGGRCTLDGLRCVWEGQWIGVIARGRAAPSTTLAEEAFRAAGGPRGAVVVDERAASLFLYGRDLFPGSVLELKPPPLKLLAVVDRVDGRVLGFVEWDEDREMYANVYDLGIFLRVLG
ncbi:MAG: hypothetical protein ABWK00_06785 [Desulfurococcaceae archaeon]